jgi:hypothetical protein
MVQKQLANTEADAAKKGIDMIVIDKYVSPAMFFFLFWYQFIESEGLLSLCWSLHYKAMR